MNNENKKKIEEEVKNIKEKNKKGNFLIHNFYIFIIMMFATLVSYCMSYYEQIEISDGVYIRTFCFWSITLIVLYICISFKVAIFFKYLFFIFFALWSGIFLYVVIGEKNIKKVIVNMIFIVLLVFLYFLFCNFNNIIRIFTVALMNISLIHINKVFEINNLIFVFLRFTIILLIYILVCSLRNSIKDSSISYDMLKKDKMKISFYVYFLSFFMCIV